MDIEQKQNQSKTQEDKTIMINNFINLLENYQSLLFDEQSNPKQKELNQQNILTEIQSLIFKGGYLLMNESKQLLDLLFNFQIICQIEAQQIFQIAEILKIIDSYSLTNLIKNEELNDLIQQLQKQIQEDRKQIYQQVQQKKVQVPQNIAFDQTIYKFYQNYYNAKSKVNNQSNEQAINRFIADLYTINREIQDEIQRGFQIYIEKEFQMFSTLELLVQDEIESQQQNLKLQVFKNQIESSKIKVKFNQNQVSKQANEKHVCCQSFYNLGENLFQSEDRIIEYKNYTWPIADQDIVFTIQKEVCSFLNDQGGRILFGVRDEDNQICGVKLTNKQQDEFTLFISNKIMSKFTPKIKIQEFELSFVPVFDPKTKNWVSETWIPKLVINQGQKLYDTIYTFVGTYKQCSSQINCFIRKQGGCQPLDSNEVREYLQKKLLLYEKQKNVQSLIPIIQPLDPKSNTAAQIQALITNLEIFINENQEYITKICKGHVEECTKPDKEGAVQCKIPLNQKLIQKNKNQQIQIQKINNNKPSPCPLYKLGHCKNLTNCDKQHEICCFFAKGSCKNPNQCLFLHEKSKEEFEHRVYKTKQSPKKIICKYFLQNNCTNAQCQYVHEASKQEQQQNQNQKQKIQIDQQQQQQQQILYQQQQEQQQQIQQNQNQNQQVKKNIFGVEQESEFNILVINFNILQKDDLVKFLQSKVEKQSTSLFEATSKNKLFVHNFTIQLKFQDEAAYKSFVSNTQLKQQINDQFKDPQLAIINQPKQFTIKNANINNKFIIALLNQNLSQYQFSTASKDNTSIFVSFQNVKNLCEAADILFNALIPYQAQIGINGSFDMFIQ